MKTIQQRYEEVKAEQPSITIADFFFEKVDNYHDDLPEFLNTFAKIKATPLPATLWSNHKKKLLLRDYESDLDTMQNDIMLALWENKYKIEGLFDSINFEYNPLDNTDYTLETTTTFGERKNNETLGSRSDSETLGQRVDNASIGARTDSETLGQRQDNSTSGAHTDTVTNKVSGYNSPNSMSANTETDNAYGKQENSNTIGSQSNSSTIGAQLNSNTIGSQSNSSTIGAQTNARTEDSHIDSYIEKKHGNIGVTSSATLIREHRDIVDYNVWTKIAQIVVDAICLSIYSDCEV